MEAVDGVARVRPLPLAGIRILEPGQNLAVPLGTRLLADMGAEIIKIESPTKIENGRTLYYPDDNPGKRHWNQGAFYHEASRNKLGLAIDLNTVEGKDLFKELVKTADVVAENFTPRVMKNFGLEYETLRAIRPDIIMLSNTGFGSTGPWANYKAMGMTLEPISGLSHFTGYLGGMPMRTAIAYTDSPAAMVNAFAILAALEFRSRTGQGQWIDLSMYELGASLISEAVMDYFMNGRTGGRMGNREPLLAPQGCYRCTGRDQWVAVSVENEPQWVSLCRVIGRPELAADPLFSNAVARKKHHDELDVIIQEWTGSRDHYEAMHRLQEAGIPAGAVLTNKEMLLDPHLFARGFFQEVQHPADQEVGRRLHPGAAWKIESASPGIRNAAPSLGQDNQSVLTALLGITAERIRGLEGAGILGDAPRRQERPRVRGVEELSAAGSIWPPDPGYKLVLQERGGSRKEQPLSPPTAAPEKKQSTNGASKARNMSSEPRQV